MLRITGRDGSITNVSSWAAWRRVVAWHTRKRCHACDGHGWQYWLIEASGTTPTRWLRDRCRSCDGQGWRS